jgi:hypothetical protein
LIGLGLACAVIHRPRRTGVAVAAAGDGERGWRAYSRAGGAVLFGAAYVQLLSILGYRLATAIALGGFVLYLGKGDRIWRAAAVGVVGALVLAELFWRGFRIPLPRASLFG